MDAQRKGLLLWKGMGLFLLNAFFAGVFGDVPDDVVYTDLHKTVQIEDSVVLKCQFRGTPLAVYWKKGDDPRTAPNLVSWIPGDPVTGLCEGERPCEIMEMNGNFSLIIKEVSMAEQGRYICRVSNYKGILIHNFTDVKLFSPPHDPVPIIDQCAVMEPSSPQSCSISTSSPINITCLASRYYPDLDLFFLHGRNKVTDLATNEWTDDDGTKNKSISIKGTPSETPYVCVAWDIPGVEGQRVATILLRSPPVSPSVTMVTTMTSAVTTWTTETEVDSRSRPAKIVLPIIIITLAGGILLIVCFWLKRRRSVPTSGEKDVEETQVMLQTKMPAEGIVSFYELRSLLYNMKTPDMKKLHNLVKELGEEKDVKTGPGPQQIYEALCRWKEKHNKGDQAKLLRDALERADLSEAWLKIPETRHDTARVSEGTLKHILHEIRDPIRIQQFIVKLVPGTVRHQYASDDKFVIQQAMEILRKWNKGPFDENPMVLLSRALERGRCNPVDRTFFYGTISYFELWSLVHSYKDDMKTLGHALHALGLLGIQDGHDTKVNRVYVLLSEWKNRYHARDQLLALKMLLYKAGLHRFFEELQERRYRTDANICDDTLEHILWYVKEPTKINNFLRELSQDLREPGLDVEKPIRDIVRAALEKLKQWIKGKFDENPVVKLSLALEDAKCSPVDRAFFKVPIHLQAPIKQEEVEVFVQKLTSRHCKRLAISISSPRIDEKTVLKISDENNDELFDTKKMISEWIVNMECSNYEKRCQLDDAVLNISRHDMTNLFRTIGYRREIEEALAQPHPASKYYNHDTIFDDDLISLAKLMRCPDAETMSPFFMNVEIRPDQVEEVLREWRDSNLTSKSPNASLESVFSQITEFMGDKTYVKYVTDDELGFIESQLKTADMKEKLLSGLYIHRDRKKGQWIMTYRDTNQKKRLPECHVEQTGNADVESVLEGEQDELQKKVLNVENREVGAVFLDILKEWRSHGGEKSCRKKLRTALKAMGMEECLLNKTPRKYMYKTELVRVAFNLLMKDVFPIIQALGIDTERAKKYRRQSPDLEKGSLCLLIQLCQGTKQMEAYNRRDFLPILLKFGYADAAKSLYLDYEQSLSELSSIVSRLTEGKFQSFIKELGVSPRELAECSGTNEEAYRIEVMRIWKSKIRPVPYHYRMHIVTALQAIGCWDLVGEVLSGYHRRSAANDDVIRAICSRLDREQTRRLCKLLKLKPGEEQKISTTKIVNWVNNWMDEYNPSPKVTKANTLDKFLPRKHMNNELVKAGFYELANEIMRLEFSRV